MSISFSLNLLKASTLFVQLEQELQDQVINATIDYIGTDDSIPPEVMVTVRQCTHTIEMLRTLRSSLMSSNVS
jgi:predicted ThiF/HesA family dinucleotide-utilizing enzyme